MTTTSSLAGSSLQRVLLAGVSAILADALHSCSSRGGDVPCHNQSSLQSAKSVRLTARTMQETHLKDGCD